MISRIGHGYTSAENADTYEVLLKDEIFVGIKDQDVPGFREIQLFRRDRGDEVEFVTIMWFDSVEGVRAFAGKDYELAVVPPNAKALLSRHDERSQHYEVKERMTA